MFAAPIQNRWLLRLGVVVVVALLVTAAILATIAVSGESASAVVAVCFLVAPPMFLVAIVLFGRLMLDFGLGEASKGELERLLETKHASVLELATRHWKFVSKHVQAGIPGAKPVPLELAHFVQTEIKKTPAAPHDVAEVLDRLVDWKRLHHAPGEWQD